MNPFYLFINLGFFLCSISVYIHRHWQFEGCYWRDRTNLTNISTFDSSYASDISNSYFNTSKRVITRSFFNERIHIWGKRITLNVIAILLAVILVVIDFLMDKRWILTPINFYPSFTNTATNQISQYRTTMILQEDAIQRAFTWDFLTGEMKYFQLGVWWISYNCLYEIPKMKLTAGVNSLRVINVI